MARRTRPTDRFKIKHPIVLAPMDPASGGALAAAVSAAGGLDLIGGYGDREILEAEFTEAGNRRGVEAADRSGDYDVSDVTVGEAVGLVEDLPPAGELVERLAAEAEARLSAVTRAIAAARSAIFAGAFLCQDAT